MKTSAQQPQVFHNVDDAEIAKFSALASRWWDLEGEFKPLHRINPLRLGYLSEHCHGLFDKKIIDIGCGGGILAESMAQQGAMVTGLDMANESLIVARLHAKSSNLNIDYIHTAVEQHAQTHARQYDVVTCMEMLEHVPDPKSVVQACARLVKPGGHVFFSTINRNPKAWLLAIVAAEYLLKLVPEGTHDIKKCIRPAELVRWAAESGLQERGMTGLHYNPFNGRFTLGGNVDVNYMLHTRYTE